MNFVGVGWQEALVIGLLLLFVVGPDRMPEVAYHIGRWVRRFQLYARVLRDELRGEFAYLEEEYKGLRDEFEHGAAEFRAEAQKLDVEFRESTNDLRNSTRDLEASLNESARSVQQSISVPAPAAATHTNGNGAAGSTAAGSVPHANGATKAAAPPRPAASPAVDATETTDEPDKRPPLVF